jgi:inorganic pyrophosphatase
MDIKNGAGAGASLRSLRVSLAAALLLWVSVGAGPVAEGGIVVRIEIPAGGSTKYEIDAATGEIWVDRFLSVPVVYPANYGYIPGSLAGDGDPLDVLVLTREPVMPGSRIRTRVIGLLRMTDDGKPDSKLIAVPLPAVDPTYNGVRDIGDLPAAELDRIRAFFQVYKIGFARPGAKDATDAGVSPVRILGFGGRAEAERAAEAAMTAR